MEVHELLSSERDEIIQLATEGLSRTPLQHYKKSDLATNKARLSRLFDLTVECIRTKNLIPMLEFSKKIAEERYRQSFDLQEVHMAFNVMEEVIWKTITDKTNPTDYPKAFGLVSTVLGFGKETLAVTYLTLVSHKESPVSLDLSTLFRGI